jgi:hypothetical protein
VVDLDDAGPDLLDKSPLGVPGRLLGEVDQVDLGGPDRGQQVLREIAGLDADLGAHGLLGQVLGHRVPVREEPAVADVDILQLGGRRPHRRPLLQ